MSKKDLAIEVRWRISHSLAQYYNYCMKNFNSLQHKHNVARQIFIQKEDGAY